MYLDEILKRAPEATRRTQKPYGWRVRVPFKGVNEQVGVIPDKIFGLEFLDRGDAPNKMYFFLEVDRGTMPATRKELRQTSFLRKLLGYAYTLREGIHTKHYGMRRVRALTVTKSAERVQSFVGGYGREVKNICPPSVFLFADKETLERDGPLGLLWTDGNGERVRVVPDDCAAARPVPSSA